MLTSVGSSSSSIIALAPLWQVQASVVCGSSDFLKRTTGSKFFKHSRIRELPIFGSFTNVQKIRIVDSKIEFIVN
jgi:hypothetical protein